MTHTFLKAVNRLLDEFEGGYSNHASDRGGMTKYGITAASYPHLDIRSLTREQAIGIYWRDWWKPVYDEMTEDLAEYTFRAAVNMGTRKAHELLQYAIRDTGQYIAVDGIIGPRTLAGIEQAGSKLLPLFRARVAYHYANLAINNTSQRVFLLGWMRRACA